MDDNQLSTISISLKKRANQARRSAWISAILIFLTVFLIVTLFYGGSLIYKSKYDQLRYDIYKIKEQITKNVASNNEESSSGNMELQIKKAELELKMAEQNLASRESFGLTFTITESVTKIGSIVISLYLIQILFNLMRYHFKVADHYEVVSEAIKIAQDDIDKLKSVISLISVGHIDFGKTPHSPVETIAEIVNGLSKQISDIPTKINMTSRNSSAK